MNQLLRNFGLRRRIAGIGILLALLVPLLLVSGCTRSAAQRARPTPVLAVDETPQQTLLAIYAATEAGDIRGIRERLTGGADVYLDGIAELWVAMKRLDQAIESRFSASVPRRSRRDASAIPAETLDGGNVIIRLNENDRCFFTRREGRWKLFAVDPISEEWLTTEAASLMTELRNRIDIYDRLAREVEAGIYTGPTDAYRAIPDL